MTDDFRRRMDGAQEAEADRDRHRMEEAILATLAAAGPGHDFSDTFSRAWADGQLTFSRSDLQVVAGALRSMVCGEDIAADLVLLRDRTGGKVKDDVLEGILDGTKVVDSTVAREYIAKLAALDRYRRAWAAGQDYLKAVDKARQEGDPEAASADLLKGVFDLLRGNKLLKEHHPEAVAAATFLDDLNARRTDGRAFLGLDCGFQHLNEVLNGLTEGVVVLAGAPSCGKTTLAKQIADHVAEVEKVPVLFYSFEQSAEELRIKSLARLSSVDSRAIWKGRTSSWPWSKVEGADEAYRRGPGPYLTIIEADRGDTIDAIRAAALMAKHRAGDKPVLLVLDYLQIIPAGKGAPDALRERIDANLSELRRLSRDIKSPVLVVSSQNREGYKKNEKPTLAALKESGGIEYSADVVICLWRDKAESEALTARFGRKTDRIEAHVLKNRNGEPAKVLLAFTKPFAEFADDGKEDLDYNAALGD